MTNKATLSTLIVVIAIALLAALAWYWYQGDTPPLMPASDGAGSSAPVEVASAPAIEPPAPVASEPAIQFPVEPAASEPLAAESAEFDFGQAMVELLGGKVAGEFFQTADFARRFVATVDNLGRSHAPPSSWPINPTGGRFLINKRGDDTVINATNSARYKPFVSMVEAVNIGQAVRFYVKVYPLLQKAYEDIGYPKRYFNDRFVEVIDQLLATPEATEPLRVRLTEVKGPLVSTRPWVRYEYVDPGFEQLSAGQKILLRIGNDNQRRLKARLVELRRALTASMHRR